MILHTLELRRYLTACIIERGGEASLADLTCDLEADGFTVPGRASKVISDALRTEVARGRVVRIERGVYVEARIPRFTRYRILQVARRLRAHAALSHGCETGPKGSLTTVRQPPARPSA